MKLLFIARPTLFSTPGGDTTQVTNTAKALREIGVEVDIVLSNEKNINYAEYDLLHLFNIIDCEDHLGHVLICKKPFVISTIYVDYSEFDKKHRKDFIGFLAKIFPTNFIEYAKTLAKFLLKGEKVSSYKYFMLGHNGTIKFLLKNAAYLLPNSNSEYNRLYQDFKIHKSYQVVVNAVDTGLFKMVTHLNSKNEKVVLCVARMEGRKNQINLIKAAAGKPYNLNLIGNLSENQKAYTKECFAAAANNIYFVPHISQEELLEYYKKAKVHVLPSWFETTGLSSLEAAAMGCNIVVSDKGDVREYFGDLAYYCNPSSPESIGSAIDMALKDNVNMELREKIMNEFTWQKAAEQTLLAYKKVLKYD
jgi:glycosyltransferase involved in cell wall biosynthesis